MATVYSIQPIKDGNVLNFIKQIARSPDIKFTPLARKQAACVLETFEIFRSDRRSSNTNFYIALKRSDYLKIPRDIASLFYPSDVTLQAFIDNFKQYIKVAQANNHIDIFFRFATDPKFGMDIFESLLDIDNNQIFNKVDFVYFDNYFAIPYFNALHCGKLALSGRNFKNRKEFDLQFRAAINLLFAPAGYKVMESSFYAA